MLRRLSLAWEERTSWKSTWRESVGEEWDESDRSWQVFGREDAGVVDDGVVGGVVWKGRGISRSTSRWSLEGGLEVEEDRGGRMMRTMEDRRRNQERVHEEEGDFVSILLDDLRDPFRSTREEEVVPSPVLSRSCPSVKAGFCRLEPSILLILFSLS